MQARQTKNSSTMLNFSLALASAFKARAFFRCSCRYNFWLRFFRLIPGTYFLQNKNKVQFLQEKEFIQRLCPRFYLDIPAMSVPSAGGPFLFVIMTVRHCLRWSGSLTASVVAFMDPLQLIWAKRASSSAFRRIPDR